MSEPEADIEALTKMLKSDSSMERMKARQVAREKMEQLENEMEQVRVAGMASSKRYATFSSTVMVPKGRVFQMLLQVLMNERLKRKQRMQQLIAADTMRSSMHATCASVDTTVGKLMKFLQAVNWMTPHLPRLAWVEAPLQPLMDGQKAETRETKHLAKRTSSGYENWTKEMVRAWVAMHRVLNDSVQLCYQRPG